MVIFCVGGLLSHAIYLVRIVIDPLHFVCFRQAITPVGVSAVHPRGRKNVLLASRGAEDIPLLMVFPSGHVVFLHTFRGNIGVHLLFLHILDTIFAPVPCVGGDLLGELIQRALHLFQNRS